MARKTKGNPTVTDVARESGVGTMTVSRVVNGGRYVRTETAERVRAAILKLGYEPNEAARILKGQAPRTIGLIVPDLADPFFATCAHAVQELAGKNGYMTLLCASEKDRGRELEELTLMRTRNVAGVLIVPSNPDCVGHLQELQARGIPVVLLDRTFPGLDAGEVMVENQEGTQKAIEHLIGHGHTRILCVGYDAGFNSIGRRVLGYRRAMAQAGLDPDLMTFEGSATLGAEVIKRLRSANPPSALFTLNNVTTTQVLTALKREGISVPKEVAMIGFDDLELASLLEVPLTAVRQPSSELGKSAMRILLDLLNEDSGGDENPGRKHVNLPTELVIRRSCGCGPVPEEVCQ